MASSTSGGVTMPKTSSRRRNTRLAQHPRFTIAGYRQLAGAGCQGCAGNFHCAKAISVGLDHRHQRHAGDVQHGTGIVRHGIQVNLDPGGEGRRIGFQSGKIIRLNQPTHGRQGIFLQKCRQRDLQHGVRTGWQPSGCPRRTDQYLGGRGRVVEGRFEGQELVVHAA